MPKRGRSSELDTRRNTLLITRYWYWTEIWQRRHTEILRTFETEEFFIRPSTVDLILRNDDIVYTKLCQERPSVRDLAKRYPSYHWAENNQPWAKKSTTEKQGQLF